jgi:hypothetical protein
MGHLSHGRASGRGAHGHGAVLHPLSKMVLVLMTSDAEEIAAQIAAIQTFALYNHLGLFFALIEKGLIDGNRVFGFNQMNSAILRQTAARTENKVAARGCSMAAQQLDEFEASIRNMVTKPPDAGTA